MVLYHPKYIFDSGPFSSLKNYSPDVFSSLWNNFSQLIKGGDIISSSEVLREIENYDDEIAEWSKSNKQIFIKPTIEEQILVQQILAKHPDLVKEEAILLGKPYANPFVIAQAKSHNCTLAITKSLNLMRIKLLMFVRILVLLRYHYLNSLEKKNEIFKVFLRVSCIVQRRNSGFACNT